MQARADNILLRHRRIRPGFLTRRLPPLRPSCRPANRKIWLATFDEMMDAAMLTTPRLRMSAVRKSFGATRALRNVSFEVAPGEVHVLIGENGAGKSTLMKILSGAHRPDAGAVELDGRPFAPANPLHARRHGVAMIYQELTLAPHLSVEENILLGEEPARFGWIKRS